MDDGKFHSDQPRSCLCIKTANEWGESDAFKVTSFANKTCYTVYYLATKTEFFGEMLNITPAQMVYQPHIMLFAAMLLKCFFSLCCNKLVVSLKDIYMSYFYTSFCNCVYIFFHFSCIYILRKTSLQQ